METKKAILKFKTNINCSGCVAKVTTFLNEGEGVGSWEVDTETRDKILTVHSDRIGKETVIKKVQDAGFKIELIN